MRFFYRLLFTLLLLFSLVVGGGLFLFQTEAFRSRLAKLLEEEGKKQGITLSLEGLAIDFPLRGSLDKADLTWQDGTRLRIEKAAVRLAFFPLLAKRLSLSSVVVDKVEYTQGTTSTPIPSSFFLDLSARTVTLRSLVLHDLGHHTLCLTAKGSAFLRRDFKEARVRLALEEPSSHSLLDIDLISSYKKDLLQASVSLSLRGESSLPSFVSLPLDATLSFSASAKGPWSFWKGDSSLPFSLEGSAEHFLLKNHPCLDRPWSFALEGSVQPDRSFILAKARLHSDLGSFLGQGILSPSFRPLSFASALTLPDLSLFALPFSIRGQAALQMGLQDKDFLLIASSSSLEIEDTAFPSSELRVEARREDGWKGKAFCTLSHAELPWKGTCIFSLEQDLLRLTECSVQAPSLVISGKGSYALSDDSCQGTLFLRAETLKPFRTLFPESDLEGRLAGPLSFSLSHKNLLVETHLLFKNVRYRSFLVDLLEVDAKLHDLLCCPRGFLSLQGERILLRDGEITKLSFVSEEKEKQTYTLAMEGAWKEPFLLSSTGSLTKDKNELLWECDSLTGSLFHIPFNASSFCLKKKEGAFTLQGLNLSMGEGTLSMEATLSPKSADLKARAVHLPLHALSLFYPTLGVEGMLTLEGAFHSEEKESQGHLLATLEEMGFLETPLKAKGSLQAHLCSDKVQLQAHLYATQEQFVDWTGTFPLKYTFSPLAIALDDTKPFYSEVRIQGALEEIFSFVQSASQKVSGWVSGHLLLSGNQEHPSLQGRLELQNGAYESYSSGTKLRDVALLFEARGSLIEAVKMSAQDFQGGSISAHGTLFLLPGFPYEIQATLHDLSLLNTLPLQGRAGGSVRMEGSSKGAKITGELLVTSLSFSLGEGLQADIPTLPVIHIHKPIHLERATLQVASSYPFTLDLVAIAKDTAKIQGRGLDSLWSGKVLLTGPIKSPETRGSLTLNKGEFHFAGKTFTLMQGELSFSDVPGQEAYMHLKGQLQLAGVLITATMQGPLSNPRLTFHSSPSLATSSILSLILFNKDIAEISPLQAVQLARVIMSLSGRGGPDVLESIRKSIGVDRLTIVEKEGSEEISVQIGWYLTHGVTVSLSQSATSSDVTIEVDLKNGFIFEAETQNQEEGKFSLKWNHNY